MDASNYNHNINNWQEHHVHLNKRATTKLQTGQSVLVDLGSRINVIGKQTLKEMEAALPKGETIQLEQLKEGISISGVGEGRARCLTGAQIPVAVAYADKGQRHITRQM